jgi:hypothetical protein
MIEDINDSVLNMLWFIEEKRKEARLNSISARVGLWDLEYFCKFVEDFLDKQPEEFKKNWMDAVKQHIGY